MPQPKEYIEQLISIITPCYNSEAFIASTILSVQAQSYKNWELIIVDDASDDASIDIIENFALNDSRIILLKNKKNIGPALTRNIALRKAKGRYIAFLDSDDLWLSSKLKIQLTIMQEKKLAFSFTGYNSISEQGKKLNIHHKVRQTVSYKELLASRTIGCLTVMIDREKTGEVLMPNILRRQDHALWLLLTKKGYKNEGINMILAKYRIRKGSISNNKWHLIKYQWLLYRKIEKLSYIESFFYLSNWAIKGVIKKNINF